MDFGVVFEMCSLKQETMRPPCVKKFKSNVTVENIIAKIYRVLSGQNIKMWCTWLKQDPQMSHR